MFFFSAFSRTALHLNLFVLDSDEGWIEEEKNRVLGFLVWHKEEGVEEGETCRMIAICFQPPKTNKSIVLPLINCSSLHTNLTVVINFYLIVYTKLLFIKISINRLEFRRCFRSTDEQVIRR